MPFNFEFRVRAALTFGLLVLSSVLVTVGLNMTAEPNDVSVACGILVLASLVIIVPTLTQIIWRKRSK